MSVMRKPAASLVDSDGNVLCDLHEEHGALVGDARESGCATFIIINGVAIPLPSYSEFVDDTPLSARADVSYEDLVGDIRGEESWGPSGL